MTDQIRDEKEFREFYQTYLDGRSPLSELYQQSEETQANGPSKAVDEAILSAAKKQTNKSHLVKFPQRHSIKPYSLAASVAIFSLVGILVFNTWEAEKRQLERELSEAIPMQESIQDTIAKDSAPKKAVLKDTIANTAQEPKLEAIPAPITFQAPAPAARMDVGSSHLSDSEMPGAPIPDSIPAQTSQSIAAPEMEDFSSPETFTAKEEVAPIEVLNSQPSIYTDESSDDLFELDGANISESNEMPPMETRSQKNFGHNAVSKARPIRQAAPTSQFPPKSDTYLKEKKMSSEKKAFQQKVQQKRKMAQPLSAEDWIEKIKQLLNNQQQSRAILEYERFKEHYPDFVIEPELLKRLKN